MCLYAHGGHVMYPIIRNPEKWVEQQDVMLDSYIERVFESETIDDWFSASHWYYDAITSLVLPQGKTKNIRNKLESL